MSIIPTAQDYPDFTRLSQFTSTAILNVTDTATSATKTLGTFYTGGFESLVVRAFNQAAGVGWVYNFSWFTEAGAVNLVGQTNVRTLSAIGVNAQIPNRGPWCVVSVTTNSVVAHAFRLLVLPRTGTPSGAGAFLDGLVHSGIAQNIAAGGNFAQNAFSVTPGEAAFTVVSTAAVWSAKLFSFDELSAGVNEVGFISNADGAGTTKRIILPTYWTQLNLHNGDGVAQLFDWSVQAAL